MDAIMLEFNRRITTNWTKSSRFLPLVYPHLITILGSRLPDSTAVQLERKGVRASNVVRVAEKEVIGGLQQAFY